VRKLGLTPQALRSYRFAVRKAGPCSRVMVDFPAQQIQGAQNSQDGQFKTNFAPPQGEAPSELDCAVARREARPPRIVQGHWRTYGADCEAGISETRIRYRRRAKVPPRTAASSVNIE
jgi:hypothetical protein